MSSLGTEYVDTQLRFMTKAEDVRRAHAEIQEYTVFEDENQEEMPCEFFDVREALLRIRPERTYLEELELFNLKRSATGVQAYAEAFMKTRDGRDDRAERRCMAREKEAGVTGENAADTAREGASATAGNAAETGDESVAAEAEKPVYVYPALAAMAADVAVYPQIIRRIDEVLNKYGKVKDTASTELLSVRHQIEVTVRSISHSLRSIITEAQSSGYIDRDVAPTLRDGRLVIPVAPALKRKIRGIVHDESATGKTIFIEPAEVVEANNKIRSLKAAEKREIIRILQELSSTIRPHIPGLLESLRFLAHIDYLRALRLYSESIRARVLPVSDNPGVDWSEARHPILEQSLAKHGEKIVPLDACLRPGQRILLISGPNAGGKSVCLKTAGLLQYMLQCGMPVPAGERSKPGLFKHIMMDIGDQQSLENDLSTYSSHLLNMREMMAHADARSLLLVDEFGGGTEPQIGGALAEAILNRFVRNLTYGIITTHYQNLKHFAEKTRAVVNAAMLYDSAAMQPLFILKIGNPGSSFAVEIARKMGIPQEVIAYATNLVGKDYVLSDKYVQDIVRDKTYWERKSQSIRRREQQLEDTIARYEREMTDFQQEKRKVMAEAKAEAKELIERSNAQIENTIRGIRESQAEKEKTREIRRELADFKDRLEQDTDEQDRIARKIAKIQRRQQRREGDGQSVRARNAAAQQALAEKMRVSLASGKAAEGRKDGSADGAIAVGSFVRVKGQNAVGRVDSISGKTAKVVFGMMFMQVPIAKLEPAQPPKEESAMGPAATFISKETRDAMYEKKLHFSPEIDMRGMRADEALTAVSYFIDDAIQLEQARVRILHGTGTGALRELVRKYLKTVPGIRTFHDEHVQFGGAGITVVEFQ